MWCRLGYSAMKTHFIVIYVVIFVVTAIINMNIMLSLYWYIFKDFYCRQIDGSYDNIKVWCCKKLLSNDESNNYKERIIVLLIWNSRTRHFCCSVQQLSTRAFSIISSRNFQTILFVNHEFCSSKNTNPHLPC